MFQPKSILVPIDFSGFSEIAFRRTLGISKSYAAKIRVLHVTPLFPLGLADWIDEPSVMRFQNDLEKSAKDGITAFLKKFPEAEGLPIETEVRSGVAYEQILKAASERRVDLIVIASHGKTGIKEHLLGGTTEKIVRHAVCDVLVVRNRV